MGKRDQRTTDSFHRRRPARPPVTLAVSDQRPMFRTLPIRDHHTLHDKITGYAMLIKV